MKNGLCAALGDFDGVHLGHAAIIKTAVDFCESLTPAVYTFSDNCKQAPVLTDNNTKEQIFRSMGIEKVIFDDFEQVRDLSPNIFVRDILMKKYDIKAIVCGSDFKFGKGAKGNTEILGKLCYKYKIKLQTVDCLCYNGEKISSTDIRKLIEIGDMERTTLLLGRPFCINGTVRYGKNLAHKHSTPTINIEFKPNSVIPAYGVYISKTTVNNCQFNSISNIGVRPSIETTDVPNIETNIFDFESNIYDKNVSIDLLKMMRPEIKFENSDELFEQIKKDIITAKKYFIGDNND